MKPLRTSATPKSISILGDIIIGTNMIKALASKPIIGKMVGTYEKRKLKKKKRKS